MKKALSLMLAAVMLRSFTACRSADTAPRAAPEAEAKEAAAYEGEPEAAPEGEEAAAPAEGAAVEPYKNRSMTGTVSQNEEEFQAPQKMLAKYGEDKIVTATYPDNFTSETETVIAQVVSLASDPEVKAIVFVQAVPGTIAAIEKTKETRPDMVFICGVAAEPPREIAASAYVVMLVDEIGMGRTVIEQAAKQGATTFIHYSFPRHLGYETIAARREGFMATCEELGIEYVEATAPDPTGDAGVAGAQQFIVEDVPRQIEAHGTETAFFSTNCSMQEPLIRSVAEQKAIYPQQCCPSPYHGYPSALNIEVAGHEGDVQYMLDQINTKVGEYGNAGRMSTWPLPINMLMVEAGVEYAIEYCEGRTNGDSDDAAVSKVLREYVNNEYRALPTIPTFTADERDVQS